MKTKSSCTFNQADETREAKQELNELSSCAKLETFVSKLDLSVLQKRFKCSDIYPKVTLELIRGQDRTDLRIRLAIDVAQTMATKLVENFSGRKHDSELVLQVNITVVSDGCSHSIAKVTNLIGRRYKHSSAKLVASYCLYSRNTGQVAISKQLCKQQICHGGVTESRPALLQLENELRTTICKEVSFASCSRIAQWAQYAMCMIDVDGDSSKADDDDQSGHTERYSIGSCW